jgi:predicted RNA-binding protein YlxR (DUF448 family)
MSMNEENERIVKNPRKIFDENGKKVYEKPMRMCVVCRSRCEKQELLRVVRGADGEIALDTKGNMAGRGAYICKNAKCVEVARNKKHLNRAFRCAVGDKVFDEILESI